MRTPGHTELTPDELLIDGAQDLGIRLRPDQICAFQLYREEILRWSERMNLTALSTPAQIVREGFLDSLACTPLIPPGARSALDVGSGAGFPSIPIAIVHAGLTFTMVEASRKKTTFLKHIARSLGLKNLRIWNSRAETLARGPLAGRAYDIALARAVAPLPDQATLVSPFLRPGGIFLAQVGPCWPVEDALKRLEALGYQAAGEFLVPPWSGVPGRRVLAFRWPVRVGGEECFT